MLRKLCVALAMNMGSYGEFVHMSVFELLDVCEDLKEIQEEAKEAAKSK